MKIVMPKLGLTMKEATLTRWLKAEGDAVEEGDLLFEFESDKSTMEYEAPAAGVLAQRLVSEGTTVPCGETVAILEADGLPAGAPDEEEAVQETAAAAVGETERIAARAPVEGGFALATPAARRRARELGVDLAAVPGRGPDGRVQLADVEEVADRVPQAPQEEEPTVAATPVARRLAADLGLEAAGITGSGRNGRVTREDVLRTARQRLQSGQRPAGPGAPTAEVGNVEPLGGVRAVIARRMSESAFTAPHVTLHTEADASALVAARRQLNEELAGRAKVSFNTLFIAVTARALQAFPRLNACLIDEEIRLYERINVAVAVDTERGLLAPVIRDADRLDLVAIQRESEALIERAQEGRSLPDDLSGGTFTVTNLGAFEVDGFTPIINQPQAAILGIGRIAPRPVAVDGEVVLREHVTLSLSFDHRIVDGGPAARFLQRIKELVERPFALLLSTGSG